MTTTPRSSFRLSVETLAELDRRRGAATRTEYVRRLIHSAEIPADPAATDGYVVRTRAIRDRTEPVASICHPIDLQVPERFVAVDSIEVLPTARPTDVEPRFKSGKR